MRNLFKLYLSCGHVQVLLLKLSFMFRWLDCEIEMLFYFVYDIVMCKLREREKKNLSHGVCLDNRKRVNTGTDNLQFLMHGVTVYVL